MQRLTAYLSVLLCLILSLCLTACSDDEAPPAAEAEDVAVSQEAPASENTTPTSSPESKPIPWPKDTTDLFSTYEDECPDRDDLSLECEWLRGLVVADVVQALEEIEQSRDQRGVEQALAALDIVDEPEVLIAGCHVLGYFPDTPGIAEKATPLLLDSPYLAVEQAAARLLSGNSDPAFAGMGSQWGSNHGRLYTDEPYAELPPIPAHFSEMDFPEYPDSQRFTPADSDRSVGAWVAETPADVSEWLADELDVEAMDYNQWSQRSSEETMKAYQVVMDPAYTEELQKLMEQYMKNQDPAIAAKMEKLQADMNAVSKKIESDSAKSLNNVLTPPGGVAMEELSYFVAEEKDGHISRAIMVYRFAGSERTVMQMAWNLRDYPPAWPEAN